MIYFFIDARARYAVLKELRRFPEENLLRVSVAWSVAESGMNRSLKTKEKTTTHLFRMEIHPVRDSSVIE